jgi:4-methylaminobutanoate oxidase (formaldehyde-forming)
MDANNIRGADVIIIGGGILGCAIAYFLSRMQVGKVVLLERRMLAEANTSRAAGLLTQARTMPVLSSLVRETYLAVQDIEETSGESLELRKVGSLHVAVAEKEKEKLKTLLETASRMGIGAEGIKPEEAMKLVLWLELPPGASAILTPHDAFADGYLLAQGYARAAKANGVTLIQNTAVKSISLHHDEVNGVLTSEGFVSAPVVIDAAGVWAGLLAWELGMGLPMAPVRSHYWFTAADPLFDRNQPFVILPDARAYTRPEGDTLLFGLRESNGVSVDPRRLPDDLSGFMIGRPEDEQESLIEGFPLLHPFFPDLEKVGIAHYITGLSTYTPDSLFVLGPVPGIKGFLVATGCCGAGIAASGGIGRAIAELAAGLPSTFDLSPFRVDRFGPVDPMSAAFQKRCADARSRKVSG